MMATQFGGAEPVYGSTLRQRLQTASMLATLAAMCPAAFKTSPTKPPRAIDTAAMEAAEAKRVRKNAARLKSAGDVHPQCQPGRQAASPQTQALVQR